MLEYLGCVAYQLQKIVQTFQYYRYDIILELIQPTQAELEWLLNEKFVSGIRIVTNDGKGQYIYYLSENLITPYIYYSYELTPGNPNFNTNASVYYIYDNSVAFNNYDFTIILPNALLNVSEIRQFVNKYNIAGKRYNIIYE
jgi:hypothetical protein